MTQIHWGYSSPLSNVSAVALLMGIVPLLTACPVRDITRPQAASASKQQPIYDYGAQGSITTNEAIAVRGLIPKGTQLDSSGMLPFAQRQSRQAIVSRIGYASTEAADYGRYRTDGGADIDVVYDGEGYAIGVRRSGGTQP